MIHYKEIEVPASKRQVIGKVVCDCCGMNLVDQSESNYDVHEVELSCKNGVSYPEGGNGEEIKFDMCNACFTNKLIPLMKEHMGVEVTWKSWDW